ncbi:MAG: VWA domain-containing protein [Deltaproteobacteria bacterium]|nr:VWA domain-containing protein [Deltaproteobacteria bacterium]
MTFLGSLGVERAEYLWLLLLALPIVGLAVWSRREIGRRRRIVATGLRLLLLLLLVLSLAGLTRQEPVDALGVVFVVDRSASVGPQGQAQALEYVHASLQHQGRDDIAGVVVFGADALVEVEPRDALELPGIESVPVPHQTDIAGGLRLASALLSGDLSRRVVVLSDGEETRGDASAQVLLTAGDDLEVAVVPLQSSHGPEVWLEDLLVPARVDEGACACTVTTSTSARSRWCWRPVARRCSRSARRQRVRASTVTGPWSSRATRRWTPFRRTTRWSPRCRCPVGLGCSTPRATRIRRATWSGC